MVQSYQGVVSTKKNKHQERGNKKDQNQGKLEKNMKRKISCHPTKQKNFKYGINTSVNSALMIVEDSRFDPEVVMST